MNSKIKNKSLFMLYALCLGAIIGAIVWVFLRLVNVSIEFLWEKIPSIIQFPFYTLLVCTIGGLIVGLWKKFTGDYPEDMETVISKAKKDGRYPYNKVGIMCVSSFLPLAFGASVGPESGLIGIIVGLCSWISDKFKHLFKEIKELNQIGISATLGTIFNSPMFGFALPIESDEDELTIPKASKVVLYFITIFGAIGSAILLRSIFGGSEGIEAFESFSMTSQEWLWLIPFSLIGVICGILYKLFNKATENLSKKLEKYIVAKCIIAGILLGVAGTFLPLVMFSGEEQIATIISSYQSFGILILFLTGIVKLLITNICNSFGLKGGHFFPNIFAGICIGYALSLLIGINPVFSACVVTTALMSFLIKKPFAVILLLMICFPAKAIPIMLLSTIMGIIIKEPKLKLSSKK